MKAITLFAALILFALGGMQGCDVEFRQSPAEHAARLSEPNLTGAWKVVTDEPKEMVYLVVRAIDGGTLSILYAEAKESGEFDLARVNAVPFSAGSKQYFSARLESLPNAKSAAEPVGYLVARYVESESKLTIRTISSSRMQAVLERGALKGTAKKSLIGTTVEVTSSPEEVVAFLTTPQAEQLFEKEFVLRRLSESK